MEETKPELIVSENQLDIPPEWWVDENGKKFRHIGKPREFVMAYVGPAKWSASQAARLAGYKRPGVVGPMMLKKYQYVIDRVMVSLKSRLTVGVDEIMQVLAEIVRDKGHKDRLRAVELSMKAHGVLSDRVVVTQDRGQLDKELGDVIKQLAAVRHEQKDMKKAVAQTSNALEIQAALNVLVPTEAQSASKPHVSQVVEPPELSS